MRSPPARWTLSGLWGDAGAVHMAVDRRGRRHRRARPILAPDGRFPSVGASHPPAIRLERAIADPVRHLSRSASPDTRPWLDHGVWDVAHPLGKRRARRRRRVPYAFLPAEGEGLHQIPVGPVHAGIIEPGHFRFTANGETVVRLEERLGYVHKGIESLMAGATLEQAAKLAGRTSGDSTVAYAYAFARAVEAATRSRAAAARRLSARADGRAGAARQSSRRYRRHLQRCRPSR